MLISSTILDDLITELDAAIARTQNIPNSQKWLGYAGARAMVDSKRRELFRHEIQVDMARSLEALPHP